MKTLLIALLTTLLISPAFADASTADSTLNREIEITETLTEAVKNIDIISLNILLSEGADVDTVDHDGNTPLMIASQIGNPRMLTIILAHEPDVNAKNNNGETALMVAAKNGQLHVAKRLIENGADKYMRSDAGLTPAELAARNGHTQIVNFLRDTNESPLSR
jgi:ankyrin repeat protein